ncbi:MAG: NAD(+) synthase [Planctomycetota bacterium]
MKGLSRRIAVAQMNPVIGDIAGNTERIRAALEAARELAADLVVFQELALPGYSPQDLLLRREFVEENCREILSIAGSCRGLVAVVGFVDRGPHNAAAVIDDGRIVGVYHKRFLPNYSVFDEKRYFAPGVNAGVFATRIGTLGVSICEDVWHPELIQEQVARGVHISINISASPFGMGKIDFTERMLRARAGDAQCYVVFCNQFAGVDGVIYYGHGLVVDPFQQVALRTFSLRCRPDAFAAELRRSEGNHLAACDVDLAQIDRSRLKDLRFRDRAGHDTPLPEPLERPRPQPPLPSDPIAALPQPDPAENGEPTTLVETYNALVLGVRDYVRKCGVKRVVLGLSGGVDSALVAYVAADALGKDAVTAIFMPRKPLTSRQSRDDAQAVVQDLGIAYREVPIDGPIDAASYPWPQTPLLLANDQARERMKILYNFAGSEGALVLGTSNKSEAALGYGTKHADMASDFAVIGGVWKTDVFRLARLRGVPAPIVEKPPTAELVAGQLDETDLGFSYEEADSVLRQYVDGHKGADEIIAEGTSADLVRRILKRFHQNEHKRTVLPRSIKVSEQSFHPIEWRQVVAKKMP